jgi:DNA-binding transcriptional ArsR family regulator
MGLLSELLSSRVRAEILRLLFDGRDREFHVRAIERGCGASFGSTRQELKKLSRLDLVKSRRDGNRLYFRANREHPIYPEIVGLVTKTVGTIAVLREALTDKTIKIAFMFGSAADGSEKAGSDLDLVVIGDIGMRRLSALLSGYEERIGRDINPHVYHADEFARRVKKREHFVARLLSSPKVFIVGTEDELAGMGG